MLIDMLLILLTTVLSHASSLESEVMSFSTERPPDIDTSLLRFEPPDNAILEMHSSFIVKINVSDILYNYSISHVKEGSRFYLGMQYDTKDIHLGYMIKVKPLLNVVYQPSKMLNATYHMFWPLNLNNSKNEVEFWTYSTPVNVNCFRLLVDSIGYPQLEFHILEQYVDNTTEVLHKQVYHLTVMRVERTVDLGFTIAITFIVTMNTFAIGCLTDVTMLKVQLKKNLIPVCITACTQYITIPVLAFALVKIAKILPELAVGVLLCSCVPGGGLGHLIVAVTGTADPELSVAINFLHIVISLGTAPLWLFSLGQLLPNNNGYVELPTHYIVICMALLLIPYLLGIIIRRFKAPAAEAILNWLVKPVLLLFMILFVTLGLYINMYALGVLDKVTLVIAGMVPSLGFCIGGGLTLAVRQGKPAAKSVAIEAAIVNCLCVVAAVKYTMRQPDCDLAVAGVLAVLFATPLPFIGMLVFHKVKKRVMTYIENRKFEREQQQTILKSFAVITQNALQISGMTPNQIAERRASEHQNNVDNTLPVGALYENENEYQQSVVELQNNASVETIPLSHSNHRNYL